jgi:hypothetical protein
MQWTTVANNYADGYNDVDTAVSRYLMYYQSFPFSIAQRAERTFTIALSFRGSSLYSSSNCFFPWQSFVLKFHLYEDGECIDYLDPPVSSPSMTTENYVYFAVTDNASGPPLILSYTSPQGSLNDSAGQPRTSLSAGSSYSASDQQIFPAPSPGNYTVHVLTDYCPMGSTCSSNATGQADTAVSVVLYNRPFYNAGLATVIVTIGVMAVAAAFLAITVKRILEHRIHPKSVETAEGFD